MRPPAERSRVPPLARWLWSVLVIGSAVTVVWMTGAAPINALAESRYPTSRHVKEDPGRWLGRWTLKTVDTTLTLGVRSDQKLYLCRLTSPAGWNWVKVPSPFPLVNHVKIGDEPRELNWRFQQGAEDHAGGSRLTITFTNADPALELTSSWQARGGPGPVRHTRNDPCLPSSRRGSVHTGAGSRTAPS